MKPRIPYENGETVRVTSPYGYRTDPLTGVVGAWHGGVDLVGQGSKVLCSPIGGVVLVSQIVTDKANRTWEWGNYVCISGDDGNLYYLCHMLSRSVSAGERVEIGDPIGIEGSTGYSTGSHCHLEVRDPTGKQIDPTELIGIVNEAGTLGTVPLGEIVPPGNVPHEWAREAVEWAQSMGILMGNERGELFLHRPATREEMIVFLHRAHKLTEGEKEENAK